MYSIDYITSIEYTIANHKVVKIVDYSIISPQKVRSRYIDRFRNPESAHSSIMGVLMLIAIVMIMGGVVASSFLPLSQYRKRYRWHIWELPNPLRGLS